MNARVSTGRSKGALSHAKNCGWHSQDSGFNKRGASLINRFKIATPNFPPSNARRGLFVPDSAAFCVKKTTTRARTSSCLWPIFLVFGKTEAGRTEGNIIRNKSHHCIQSILIILNVLQKGLLSYQPTCWPRWRQYRHDYCWLLVFILEAWGLRFKMEPMMPRLLGVLTLCG